MPDHTLKLRTLKSDLTTRAHAARRCPMRSDGPCKIRVETPTGRDFLSETVYPSKEAARDDIRAKRRTGDWKGCRFFITLTELGMPTP